MVAILPDLSVRSEGRHEGGETQKWQYRGLFGRLFSAVSSSAIEVDRSHPVPRSSCSENSRVVKLFLKEDESVYLSQLRKTFSPSLLGSA